MKKLISVALCLALMLTLAACGGSGASKMTMGTGGTSGTYYAFGGVLGQYIKNNAGNIKSCSVILPIINRIYPYS